MVLADEAAVVHVSEHTHQKPTTAPPVSHSGQRERKRKDALAVHAVGHAAVARDAVPEILDVERALEARGEESAKGRDERREAGEEEDVVLVGRVRDRCDPSAELRAGASVMWGSMRKRGRTSVESATLRGPGMAQSRQTKAGLGTHVAKPSKALTPRSRTGQIMYWKRMK